MNDKKNREPMVIALATGKGGSGATFVAANLAHLLAAGGRRRVALPSYPFQRTRCWIEPAPPAAPRSVLWDRQTNL